MAVSKNGNSSFKAEINLYLGSYTTEERAQEVYDWYSKQIEETLKPIFDQLQTERADKD